MKKQIVGFLILLLFLLLASTNVLTNILDFFNDALYKFFSFIEWLFTLNATKSEVSSTGLICIKIITFVFSYLAVGVIFNLIGRFNKKAMKFAYVVISTILSFVLCYIVMLLEKYIVVISIVLIALLLLTIAGWVSWIIWEKRKKAKELHNSVDGRT